VAQELGIRITGGYVEVVWNNKVVAGGVGKDIENEGHESKGRDIYWDYDEQFAVIFCSKLLI
jgi:hypothetical protein